MDINAIEAKVAQIIEGIILTQVDPDTLSTGRMTGP